MTDIREYRIDIPQADLDDLADRLSRLLADIARHHQRVQDLAYDDVELEIGGSE